MKKSKLFYRLQEWGESNKHYGEVMESIIKLTDSWAVNALLLDFAAAAVHLHIQMEALQEFGIEDDADAARMYARLQPLMETSGA